jgi:quercetin dioxygenase-like cupin family protein
MVSAPGADPDPGGQDQAPPTGNFTVIDHEAEAIIEGGPGNRSRVLAAASHGATCMSVVERWLDPGKAIALHRHPDGIEEVIWVRGGRAEFTVDGESAIVGPDQTVVIAPGSTHAIQAVGDETLWMFCRYSSATPTVVSDGGVTISEPPWVLGF